MLTIKILGIGSHKYKLLAQNLSTAIQELNLEANVEHLEEIEDFIRFNIVEIPSLMIDDEVKIIGRVPDVNELKILLASSEGASQR